MSFIYKAIGTFLGWLDFGTNSYLLALFVFAVVVELLFLPFGIKQQKNSIRQARLRPKEMAIRKKYAGRNDKVTQQKVMNEIQELYQKEGYNQLGGCLPMILQLAVIMLIYQVVIQPMSYVVQLDGDSVKNVLESVKAVLIKEGTMNEKGIVSEIQALTVIEERGLGFLTEANGFTKATIDAVTAKFAGLPDFTLFGGAINLGYTPTLAWNWLLLVPVLTFVVYFSTMKITRLFTYQPAIQDEQAGCSMKIMDWIMPLMSLFISFRVPAAIGVYWIFKSIVGTVKQFVLHKAMPVPHFTEEDYKAAELEMKGKAPVEERELPPESEYHSYCSEDEDDDEPYPTFVGVKGGVFDDDGEDEKTPDVEEKTQGLSDKLTDAPIKEDVSDKKGKKNK